MHLWMMSFSFACIWFCVILSGTVFVSNVAVNVEMELLYDRFLSFLVFHVMFEVNKCKGWNWFPGNLKQGAQKMVIWAFIRWPSVNRARARRIEGHLMKMMLSGSPTSEWLSVHRAPSWNAPHCVTKTVQEIYPPIVIDLDTRLHERINVLFENLQKIRINAYQSHFFNKI